MANRPEPEIEITSQLVTALLADQFPELVDLRLQPLSRGWDNTNLMVGDELIARIPHRFVAAELITNEQRWLPTLAPLLDLAIPAPTHAGRPTDFFPLPWSITPFAPGTEAARAELIEPTRSAELLGTFFRQLHVAAPAEAPLNPYRGCPLHMRRDSFRSNLAAVAGAINTDAVEAVFATACDIAPPTDRVWLHGDLHARNMIIADGQLASIIDWGDICAGDRATDLAGTFMLAPNQIGIVANLAGASEADWIRARGWAAHFALVYLAHSDDDPLMGQIGTQLLTALLDG